ncbi:MAG: xanthine dehydrogenase family protein molybdopterin-binding subunit [Myxococcota bacterium]|nr:xanthine dehydrogenase family protein molybdopterin-binding subunit [Myxococcota bacterium]
MDLKYVGKPIIRPDAVRKATGKAQYLDDLKLPGMLYAAILRPERGHARIVSIDTTAAEGMPGVVKVVTGQGCTFRYGDNIRDLVPMAVDRVRYAGEPVAAVVADSVHHARQALRGIEVVYEPLPVYTDALDALAPGAELIHPEAADIWHLPGLGPQPGTNIGNHYRLRKGDVEQGFAEADVVVEGEFVYPFGSCAAIEPHGCISWFHEEGTIEIWSSSICPFIIREEVARVYGKPVSDVRVHIPELGGCFGYKSDITVEQTIAWIASFVPGRPVKWVATRQEDFTSTLTGHGIRTRMKIGAKKDGTLTALRSEIFHSGGAYADTAVHVTIASTHNCTGAYEYPHCLLDGYTVYTNTTPVGAYRGYGHQESQFATERLLDQLARKLEMDPFVLRAKNYLGPGKQTSLGETLHLTTGQIEPCVAIVREKIFGHELPAEDDRYWYGRGFAALMKSPKGAPFSSKGVHLKFNVDGSVSINAGGAEVGQGLRNVVRQIAAETLQIAPERIRVYTEIDTQFSPYEWQTIGSMFTMQGGRAVWRACLRAIQKLKETAAQVLRTDVDFLGYDGERVFLLSDPTQGVPVTRLAQGYLYPDNGITIGEVVAATADSHLPRYSGFDANGQGSMGVTYTFGAQGCEIRIDKQTLQVTVDHFATSLDLGRAINPLQARGQVAGGVMMALGATLHEELRYDELGRQTNPHYRKYRFPSIKDAPTRQTIEFVETPDAIGPYGCRGIGEHPVIGVAPAILNAIHDALGIELYELPVTPEKIRAALAAQGRA